jgi:hypothetical protein
MSTSFPDELATLPIRVAACGGSFPRRRSTGLRASHDVALLTPKDQVQFLRNVQRLLAEGLFVASYKFALIHALADLAVLKGDDTGAPLDLDTRDIAAKFVELYWQQCRPFHAGAEPSGQILLQNADKRQR